LKALKGDWNLAPDEAGRGILGDVNPFASKLLDPVPRSIMTNISGLAGSTFIPELYLANFAVEERRFVKAVSETQMMQFHVQACVGNSPIGSVMQTCPKPDDWPERRRKQQLSQFTDKDEPVALGDK
jgi:hypothetical protein